MHFPLVPGDNGPDVTRWQQWFNRAYISYAPPVSGTYGAADVAATKELQRRLGLNQTGNFNIQTAKKSRYIETPLIFSVEGHMSDMWRGPVADTAAQLEAEGLAHHQPIGYQNGSIPFDNASGANELARLFGLGTLDSGVAFPLGTPYVLEGFSQGAIVVTDFIANFLQPSQLHAPRAGDCLGVLMYGNPTRSKGSVAPWSRAQAGPAANTGLDPLARLDTLGITLPYPVMDVYRKGDIFADNEPTEAGEMKAAVYLAVARGDIFSNPHSLVAKIADLFSFDFDEVWAVFMAIVSGIGFLATGDHNPHYSPYDISGGIDWVRNLLS